jgi:hypothetical protein
MMGRFPLAIAVALGAPAALQAQNVSLYPLGYYGYGSDTAFAVPIGGTRALQLYGSATGGVSAYSITVFFDTTRMRIVRADSVPGYNLPSPTVTPIGNGATLTAAGTGYGYGADLALLTMEMKATATTGSLLSLRVNQWTTQTGAAVAPWTLTTEILNGCTSRVLWGDPDSSLTVTGRDALIALTSAVQLPVSGFDLAVADVDEDLAVTSRDALLMLSYAVSGTPYYYYYYGRTGIPVADLCAPLAGVPSDMAFKRGLSGALYRVPAGDSVAIPVLAVPGFGEIGHGVRWAPDGSRLLTTGTTAAYYYEPVAVTLATLALDTLARNGAYDGGGTYSPDGSRIAFFSDRATPYLWVMDASGANPAQLQTGTTVSGYTATNPAWSPDGERVAFPGYQTCCTRGLWSVLVADGTTRLEFPINASYPPLHPAWSPAGDSLAFQASARIYAVASPDTATVPRPAVTLQGALDLAGWTSAGIMFRRRAITSDPGTWDYYLRQPDGRILRIYRAAGYDDVGATFR